MQNKYGLTQAQVELSERIAAEIVKNIQAKGLNAQAVIEKMKAANDKLASKNGKAA